MSRERNVFSAKKSRFPTLLASVATLALLPAIALSGSAAMESGGFSVKSQSVDSPEIFSIAGANSNPSTTPSEPTPTPDPSTDPETPSWGASDIVFRVDTTAAGCTKPGLNVQRGTATISWGDGTTDSMNSNGRNSHDYADPGIYDIRVTGKFEAANDMATGAAPCLIEVPHWGADTGTKDINRMFNGARNLTAVATPPSGIEYMENTFSGAQRFNQNINDWDVSMVRSMSGMFLQAYAFNQPLDGWRTDSLMMMDHMFMQAEAFNQDLGNFDTSRVVSMDGVFKQATAFNGDITNWDTGSAETMRGMFQDASSFNRPLNWDTRNVSDMTQMFLGASSFDQHIGEWEVDSLENLDSMFAYATKYRGNMGGWENPMLQAKVDSGEWTGNNTDAFMEGNALTLRQLPLWMRI